MGTRFGERVDPAAAIGAILGSYPFSIGLLRELIQNSEDAGASKQVFELDFRHHPTRSLCDPKLGPIQGPALLAYNDAMFRDDDWEALQNIHKSSKKTDTSKIGKYGVGIRSCYHVSDYLQVLSGSSLVILDPLHTFSDDGGARFNFIADRSAYHNQLAPFDSFLPSDSLEGNTFRGTVVRLPLRNAESRISSKIVRPSEIEQLFRDFVQHEMDIALLFLKNVKSIKIYQVDTLGMRTCIAKSTFARSGELSFKKEYMMHVSHVRTTTEDGMVREEVWRTLSRNFPPEDAISLLTERLGSDAARTLTENKLNPNISISIPSSILSKAERSGRLFTFLPLPLATGFPAHVHALFALTQSRQNLRNEDTGTVKTSDDRVFVEWNHILFDHFIPHAWDALLEALVESSNGGDVFQAWPPAQPISYAGDSVNWQKLPCKLVEHAVSSHSTIWPVLSPQREPTQFVDLAAEAVVVVNAEASDALLAALARAGLKIVRPPLYIVDLLPPSSCAFLTPQVVYRLLLLLKFVPKLEKLSDTHPAELTLIFEYLLSSGNVENVVGLPLIPLFDGRRATLHLRGENLANMYTMFDKSEFDVFGLCDHDAIPLHMLSRSAAETLRTAGPASLNVERLQWQTVVRYLELYPNRFDLDLSLVRVDARTVEWLSQFWDWMGSWRDRETLRQHISHLYLLPSQCGLKLAGDGTLDPVFEPIGIHPSLLLHLRNLGVVFLDSRFATSSKRILKSYGFLNHVDDVESVLRAISPTPGSPLDAEGSQIIVKHIVQHVHPPLSDNSKSLLRRLPLFPVLSPGLNADHPSVSKSWGSIPEDKRVIGVFNSDVLPLVKNVVFLDINSITPSILTLLEPSESKQEMEVIKFTLDHFNEQPQHIQAFFVHYITKNRDRVPPNIIKHLSAIPFVGVSGDAALYAPSKLVDPSSPIAILFKGSEYLPRTITPLEESLVANLRHLELLQKELTPGLVSERIKFVARIQSEATGKLLISMISCSTLNSDQLAQSISNTNGLNWLPTDRGLLSPEECRDNGSRPELFSEVLGLLYNQTTLPSDLRHALQWDKPIPLSILIQQLERILEKGSASKEGQQTIIKELALRDLNDLDIKTLLRIVNNRKWIPVESQEASLVGTADAVLSPTPEGIGFYEISFNLKASRSWLRIQKFLKRMGCDKRPSIDAIISKLEHLQEVAGNLTIKTALDLLSLLTITEFADPQLREKILVPDREGCLRPLSNVYYNDISDLRACLPDEGNYFLAHPLIDENLSKIFHMERLGLRLLPLQNPELDMGEKPITTIRNALRQYTEQQFLLEFLANAADAGATEFTVLVDEQVGQAEHLISRALVDFQLCPSVLIHNNANFSEKDFEGLCKTGIGGKAAKSNTIGQFGLGALTMFHLTELAMVVSGDHVLFLNPSRELLPFPDRVSLLLPLDHVAKFYPDHLKCLDGLFDFKFAASMPYKGTIFKLPLRSRSQIGTNKKIDVIFPRIWTVEDIKSKILGPFEKSAPECLLFTQVRQIQIRHRNVSGKDRIQMSVRAKREACDPTPAAQGESYQVSTIVIEIEQQEPKFSKTHKDAQQWMTVTTDVRNTPAELRFLSEKYRLRLPPTAGLAACITPISNRHDYPSRQYSFFSTLSLAVPTTLPVHVTGSFILSPDRRNIRLDGTEAEYNKWLLTSILPSIYIILLENLLTICDNNLWWPGNHDNLGDNQEDGISLLLINAFYNTHLKGTDRRVFRSVHLASPALSPREVVLLGSEPPAIIKTLVSLLQPPVVAKPHPRIYSRLISEVQLASARPSFVKAEILRDPSKVTSSLSFQEIEVISGWLLHSNEPQNLVGLPLLPLADNQYGEFQNNGSSTKTYYMLDTSSENQQLFRQDHLVHPNFGAAHLVDVGLNVENITPDAVKVLVEECLPPADEQKDVSSSTKEWISAFWKEYPRSLNTPPANFISSFPLVPTMQPGHFVSLNHCKSQQVIITNHEEEPWVWDCFNLLGIIVVDPGRELIPSSLLGILGDPCFPRFNYEHALAALEPISATVSQKFTALGPDLHTKFSKWIRSKICHEEYHLTIARALPIWPASRRSELSLQSACEVGMLPQGIPVDTAALFMDDIISEYSYRLTLLRVEPMKVSDFCQKLILPQIFSNRDLSAYKKLLVFILDHSPSNSTLPLLIPNSNGVQTLARSLYARDDLFIAAFTSSSPLFVSEVFHDQEGSLRQHGLQQQSNLNINMFKACAQALHDDRNGNKVVRAAIVFRVYSEDLPLRINSDSQSSWKLVDNLQFIPRYTGPLHRTTNSGSLDVSSYAPDLPNVVAPCEIAREEYEAISWTQRARFQEKPNQRIVIANPLFGVPEAEEVVKHLRVLALQVAIDYPSNPHILRDLKITYEWLNSHAKDVADSIMQHHSEPLFLNVDDPESKFEEWQWNSADELFFEEYDHGKSSRYVRKFLLPFKELLLVGGAQDVVHSKSSEPSLILSPEAELQMIREIYEDMRKRSILTDVVFIPDDADTVSNPLVAHRSFLSVFSEHFRVAFWGGPEGFIESAPGAIVRMPVKHSAKCVEAVLDYAYTGRKRETKDPDELLEILELSSYWNVSGLFDAVQRKIGENLIHPSTLDEIRKRAKDHQARILLNLCDEYETNNAAYIRRMRGPP